MENLTSLEADVNSLKTILSRLTPGNLVEAARSFQCVSVQSLSKFELCTRLIVNTGMTESKAAVTAALCAKLQSTYLTFDEKMYSFSRLLILLLNPIFDDFRFSRGTSTSARSFLVFLSELYFKGFISAVVMVKCWKSIQESVAWDQMRRNIFREVFSNTQTVLENDIVEGKPSDLSLWLNVKAVTYYGRGHGSSFRVQPFLQSPVSYEGMQDMTESEDEGPCYGKRCTANEHCCPGSVCVDVDGIGSCLFPYGLRLGELCRRHSDCETGLICADSGELKTCQPPFTAPKQYSEECTMSSECDIHKGLCCQFQRRHRQVARKVCSYFKDPLVCIGPVASDQVKVDVERTAGEKRITGKAANLGFNHLRR